MGVHDSSSYCKAQLGCSPPWIAGVINVTPDSFSDGGDFLDEGAAVARVFQLQEEGAHIVDIGGESTGPGASPVSEAEEWRRIGGVVKAAAASAFISVDTFKASTAAKALECGARMINDVSALRADPDLAKVVASSDALLVLMFSKQDGSHPHVTDTERSYGDVISEILEFQQERIEFAVSQGVRRERIIIDPGMGRFLGADPELSWTVLRRLDEFHRLGLPIMIGVSRKGFLGGPLAARDPISQLAAVAAVNRGAHLVRTHNVPMLKQFLDVSQRLHHC